MTLTKSSSKVGIFKCLHMVNFPRVVAYQWSGAGRPLRCKKMAVLRISCRWLIFITLCVIKIPTAHFLQNRFLSAFRSRPINDILSIYFFSQLCEMLIWTGMGFTHSQVCLVHGTPAFTQHSGTHPSSVTTHGGGIIFDLALTWTESSMLS